MATMRLLVHIAGEADLLLDSRNRTEATGAERVTARCRDLADALAGPGGPAAARQLLTKGAWKDDFPSTPAPSPLLGALDALDATSDLAVVLLGTRQDTPRLLDMLPVAQTLTEVLNAIAADEHTYPVQTATALPVPGLTDKSVVETLTRHLGEVPGYRQTLVTWGSGSTALAMGVLSALSRAGLPWQLVLTGDTMDTSPTYEIVDPLERLDVDPVAGVFVRWRMFAALERIAGENPPGVQLTADQRDLVRRAAERNRAGFEARDCASLRAVLADAVVRRDGSASLAVRRYVVSQYEELLAIDRATHPEAQDLLRTADERFREELRRKGKRIRPPTLGQLLGWINKHRASDTLVRASIGLPSYEWLFSPEVDALQNIGKGSHNIRPPAPRDAKVIGEYLSRYSTDGGSWEESGLPEPPVTPADTVLAVWPTGVESRPKAGTVGQQVSGGLPSVVLNHLGVKKARIRAVIFAVDDGQGSLTHADADADLISGVTHEPTGEPRAEAWVEPIPSSGIDPVAVEQAVESRLTRETGALLLVPTGRKPVVLALLRAMRRIGARHGIPLFVRQTVDPAQSGVYTDVHVWPALTGGDLPLLDAAKGALRALELDVAWRLLAASAIGEEVTDKARRLAAAFASRPLPETDLGSASDRVAWTSDLIAHRLEMVDTALEQAKAPADRIRLLVLAADVMEASIAAKHTSAGIGAGYRKFREELRKKATGRDRTEALAARILLLLNAARDKAPITHGTTPDPDDVVANAADRLVAEGQLAPADAAMLPRHVSTLVRRAVAAAAELGHGQPKRPDGLLQLHKDIIEDLDSAISRRRSRSEAPQPSRPRIVRPSARTGED